MRRAVDTFNVRPSRQTAQSPVPEILEPPSKRFEGLVICGKPQFSILITGAMS